MLGPLGPAEIIFIVVLALLIFGPRRLPEVGRTVGKAMGEFRRATTELKRSVNTELALEEEAAARPGPGGPARSGDRRREPESWQPRDPAPAG
ncbi:MAG TPA: twin-arginine translocase TatA/TatE family subunit, partial [Thermoanaerobaculia bacterium]|nr:twin-arginine translocase TatA/TatE family subunit [Thermoanaerobaculia bacterium]